MCTTYISLKQTGNVLVLKEVLKIFDVKDLLIESTVFYSLLLMLLGPMAFTIFSLVIADITQ